MECGAPGDPPTGNCESKCAAWLKRCNEDYSIQPLEVLGKVIQKFMDLDGYYSNTEVAEGKRRINDSLAKNQLSYQLNGHIVNSGASVAVKTLADFLKIGDYASVEVEFQRAITQIDTDPHAAITAASSIIESLCKIIIESSLLEMPNNQSILPLWKIVQTELCLNTNQVVNDDLRKMLQGLASIIDSIGAFRTHIGSAHGRGITPPSITAADARLAVNSSHTIVIYLMEKWKAKRER